MSIQDYVVFSDHFEPLKRGLSRFDFPCCSCEHSRRSDSEEPCRSCGHNLSAVISEETEK